MSSNDGEVTRILHAVRQGDRAAQDLLIPLVYRELRRIASAHLKHESPNHSLQPTALVHEAFMRLIGIDRVDWQNRAHFFSVASSLMRRVLVDHARAHRADKRGGGAETIFLEEALTPSPGRARELVALDDALDHLAQLDKRQAKIVEMRFFAGMTEEETGEVLGISPTTVKRDWRIAKAWLYRELGN
ncbi:RNA polymerase sigma factor (TIGR02999 family) [Granulicella aggregans]|uniref:RNA polymerase sigma factor (TIGR02999 family) n=1 Tax=Granulicella aggregans TaxID=474949 RepID=A0A7W8E4Q0_9BACT|nr:RNA polymerase sigma factor (TIGR02999 family) [Granulicella aggregans]